MSSVPPEHRSACDLVEAYRARTLSPVEVVRACLTTIQRRNGGLRAFVIVDEAEAIASARRSEARWRAGEPLGLLDGVPVSVKDLCLTAGLPTRSGSLTTSSAPGSVDAPAVARLREHGAVVLGKTATCEFGWKGVTDSPLHGISRNPWSPARTCGGSSGGAAIAAATGMGALHLGSDGAGSIRIPAAFCGVYGFKATFGRVPAYPPGRVAVGHHGPLTRTVHDAALMLTVIAQPDARDWTALPYHAHDYRTGIDDGVRGWRIAWCPDLCSARPDPEIASLIADAAQVFQRLGAIVEEVASPIPSPRAAFELVWAAGMAQIYRKVPKDQRHLLDPGFADIARAGLGTSGNQLLDAFAERHRDGAAMNAFHQTYDLLMTPQMPSTAFAAGVDFPGDRNMRSWFDWSPYTYPFNWTQQPAASIPCGLSSDGLPVGLQLTGARYAEDKVLRASRAFECAVAALRMP